MQLEKIFSGSLEKLVIQCLLALFFLVVDPLSSHNMFASGGRPRAASSNGSIAPYPEYYLPPMFIVLTFYLPITDITDILHYCRDM